MNNNDKRNLCTGCGLMPQKPVRPKPPVCGCKKKKCCKKDCCENDFVFRKVVIPAALGDDTTGKAKPENGAYTNSYVEYEANGAQYMYDSYGVYTKIESGGEGTLDFNELENRPKYAGEEMTGETDIPNLKPSVTALQGALADERGARIASDTALSGSISDERDARISADSGLQTQIDALSASSDVTDIVGTYAALQAYDTSTLSNNDIIKVLQDEEHDDETTYYRWSTATQTFTLIGEEGPYYTKAAADQKFQDKLTAGDGVTIDSDNVISADGETIFYANLNETGTTRHIYKDINFTSAASAQDVIDANDKGQVILRGTSLANPTAYSDSYLQNAFIMPHNNDYEFVFLDRDLRYEYTVSDPTDTAFYYDTSEIQPKLTAGSNVQITGTTISATDTTYSNFTGTDGVDAGTAGLVPAPATTDAGKYLKADGTWDTVSGGIPTNATFWGASYDSVNNKVDGGLTVTGNRVLKIMNGSVANQASINSVKTGSLEYLNINGVTGIQFGLGASAGYFGTINTLGWSVNNYKIINLADPTVAQDAATKNYTDNLVISYASLNGAGAPTTSTAAQYVGQLYLDTTNDDMYYCSAITPQGTTPETYTYTWNTIGGGAGIPTTATFWGQSYDAVNNKVSGNIILGNSGGVRATSSSDKGLNFTASDVRLYSADDSRGRLSVGQSQVAIYNASLLVSSGIIHMNNHRITNVTNPASAQDAATKNYVDTKIAGTSETLTIATTDWTALSASDPYDYSATVTATTTISATSTVELINDQAVLFGTHGFAIGSVDTTNNTLTIYSIGQPSASVSLTIKVRS